MRSKKERFYPIMMWTQFLTTELLKPFLSAGADSRLKNIVASIQTEQNRIIREDLHKNLIVQGAAGQR